MYFEPSGNEGQSALVGTNERAVSRRVLGSTGDNASKCRLDVWTEMTMDLEVLPGVEWQAIAFKVGSTGSTACRLRTTSPPTLLRCIRAIESLSEGMDAS